MENTETLDRISELAKEKMASMEKEKAEKEAKQKTKEETKDASSDKSSTETKKTEGTKEGKKEETQEVATKNDVQILESDDKDLDEKQLARKQELIKEKEDAKTPEQKQKEWQEKTQKRIDEVIGELKAEKESRNKDADTIKALEGLIVSLKGELESSGSLESDEVKTSKTLEESWAKMVDEDKDLPREKRREMSAEELEEFLLEDYAKAHEWIVDRKFRRDKERADKVKVKEAAQAINEGAKRFFTKYPNCNQSVRGKELVAQGKTVKEAEDIIMAEVPDYKIFMEIMRDKKDDPRYADPKTGPDLMIAEMEKRKTSKPKETFTKEEVEKMKKEAVEAEKARIASIDETLSNTSSGTVDERISNDPLVKLQWEEWCKASKRPSAKGDWSKAAFLKVLDRGTKLQMANPR